MITKNHDNWWNPYKLSSSFVGISEIIEHRHNGNYNIFVTHIYIIYTK